MPCTADDYAVHEQPDSTDSLLDSWNRLSVRVIDSRRHNTWGEVTFEDVDEDEEGEYEDEDEEDLLTIDQPDPEEEDENNIQPPEPPDSPPTASRVRRSSSRAFDWHELRE